MRNPCFVDLSWLVLSVTLLGSCGGTGPDEGADPGSMAWPPGVPPPSNLGPPRLQSIEPTQGPSCGGLTLSLAGQNFATGATVQVGGALATEVAVWSGTRITARLPANSPGSGRVPVIVQNPDGQQSSSDEFLYYDCPLVLPAPLFDEGSHAFVVAEDFNGDGRPDIVLAAPSSVHLLLNDKKGGFLQPSTFMVGTTPSSAVTADFNRDGKLDVAVANRGSDNVSVLLGNGTGGFAAATSFAIGTAPASLATADLNHDGNADLVTANFGSNNVSILLGDGMGGFVAATSFAISQSPTGITIGDLNGDGNLDLVTFNLVSAATCDDYASVLLGDGQGNFGPAKIISTALHSCANQSKALVLADFDGDTKLDMAIGDSTNKIQVYLGDGTGGFRAGAAWAYNGQTALTVTDWNRDQKPDLIVGGSYDLSVLLGDGTGGFTKQISYYAGAPSNMVAVADFNGDLIPDLISATSLGAVLLVGDGVGSVATATSFGDSRTPFAGPYGIGDFNGDQKLDLLGQKLDFLGNYTGLILRMGNGAGGVLGTATTNVAALVHETAPVVADFNGDGKLDAAVVTSLANLSVSVLLGDGKGNLGPLISTAFAGAGAYQLLAGDYNGDKRPDLVVTKPGSPTVLILFGNGLGQFPTNAAFSLHTPLLSAVEADFNADGKLDVAAGQSGAIEVLIGDGAGGFSSTMQWPISGNASSVVAGDLNGDKGADLAYIDPVGTTVGVLWGNALGGFSTPVLFPVGTYPVCIAVGDLNADHKLDLIVTRGGALNVLMSDGQGGFAPAQAFSAFSSKCATVGDINGDGKADVVFEAGPALLFLNQSP